VLAAERATLAAPEAEAADGTTAAAQSSATALGDYLLCTLLRMLKLNLQACVAADTEFGVADAAAVGSISTLLTRMVTASSSSSSSTITTATDSSDSSDSGLEAIGIAAAQAYGVGIRYFLVEPRRYDYIRIPCSLELRV